MTGIYTGRSPKDKFIVMDETSKDTVWWTSEGYKNDNHPASKETWAACKDIAIKELSQQAPVRHGRLLRHQTRAPAWPSASSWKSPGRPIS